MHCTNGGFVITKSHTIHQLRSGFRKETKRTDDVLSNDREEASEAKKQHRLAFSLKQVSLFMHLTLKGKEYAVAVFPCRLETWLLFSHDQPPIVRGSN